MTDSLIGPMSTPPVANNGDRSWQRPVTEDQSNSNGAVGIDNNGRVSRRIIDGC